MKKTSFKKMVATICSLVMLFSMFGVSSNVAASPIFEGGNTTGSIEISKFALDGVVGVNGIEFSYIKVADVEQINTSANGAANQYEVVFKLDDNGKAIFNTVAADYNVNGENYYKAKTLQDNLNQKADLNNVTWTGKGNTANATATTAGKVKFENLPIGVYLINETNTAGATFGDNSQGTVIPSDPFLVSVPTTVNNNWEYNVAVTVKNNVQGIISKQAGNLDGTGFSVDEYTSTIGKEFMYKINMPISQNATGFEYKKFNVNDTAEDGITYAEENGKVKGLKVVVGNNELDEGVDYNVQFNTGEKDFDIEFTQAGLTEIDTASANADTNVSVEYVAYLNENVDATNNGNTATLVYNQGEDDITILAEAEVKTYDISITKEFVDEATYSPTVTDVKFKISTDADGANVIYGKIDTSGYILNGSVTAGDNIYTSEFALDANKKLNIYGLANGTYYLTEISTDGNYSLLKEAVPVTINNGDIELTVVNDVKVKFELPLTGGSGTYIYTAGGLAFIGLAIYLISKNKKNNKES